MKWNLGGWILFVICSLFYIVDGIKSGSVLYLTGSIFFLAACGLFLVPVIREVISARKTDTGESQASRELGTAKVNRGRGKIG